MAPELAEPLQRYLADRYPGAQLADFQFLVSGWESDVYTFKLQREDAEPRPLILRLYPGEGAAAKMGREALGLRQLHRAGYPVPELLFYEVEAAFLGQPFVVMEKLEGSALWPVLAQATPEKVDDLLDQFGALLAHLHRLDWRPFTEQATRYAAHPAVLLDELLTAMRELYLRFDVPGFLPLVAWLEAHKAPITIRPAVVHLDFHANNVFLCTDNHLAVIDWTQVTVSDYRYDLCWSLLVMGDLGQTAWGERILQGYRQAAQYPLEQLDYFRVIVSLKLLASTVISLKTNPAELGLRPETVANLRQQVPILKELARRVQALTGLSIPEVETALAHVS